MSKNAKTVAVVNEWPGFLTYNNPPYAYLRENGYKVYPHQPKPSATQSGKLYWVGTKANAGGGIDAGVVTFIENENSTADKDMILSKKDLREMSAAAKETKCKKATIYTNFGLEVRSDEDLQESVGFDKLVKVVKPFKSGGTVGPLTQYSKFDNSLLNHWRNYGGSSNSVFKEIEKLKKISNTIGGAIYQEYGFINYNKLINSLSQKDLFILNKIMVENNAPEINSIPKTMTKNSGGIIGEPSMPGGGDFRFDIHSPLFKDGGQVEMKNKVLDPEYYKTFTLKGNGTRRYNLFGIFATDQERQANRKLFPGMAYTEHQARAKHFNEKFEEAKQQYLDCLETNFEKEFGRKVETTDYKVSGIWTDDFSEGVKDKLRKYLGEMQQWKSASYLHNSVLHKKDKVGKVFQFEKGGQLSDQEVAGKAKTYESEWNGMVKGFESTWNKGLEEYEGKPVVYFVYEDDISDGYFKVASGIAMPDNKLINTSDSWDGIFKHEIDALRTAYELANDKNYGVDSEEYKSGGNLLAPGEKAIKIKPYSYLGWHYPKQIVWVDLQYKHPDPMGKMIWGYGQQNDPVSDFKGFFESAGPVIELTLPKGKYETANQEKGRRIEVIRNYVYGKEQKKARGGEISKKVKLPKEEKVTIMLAISFLSNYARTFHTHQVGFTQTQKLIEDLSINPTHAGNLNLAILSLQSFADDPKWADGKNLESRKLLVGEIIPQLEAMAKKYQQSVMENGGQFAISKPSEDEKIQFLDMIGRQMIYLYEKNVDQWDEYDYSNWRSLVREATQFLHTEVAKSSGISIDEYNKLDPATKNELYKNLIKSLAAEFAKVIREWISPADMEEVVRLNKTPEYKTLDATHEYVDANMAMDKAFTKVMGREYVFFDDDNPGTEKQNTWDTNLQNAAWSLAKKNDFNVEQIEALNSSKENDFFKAGGQTDQNIKYRADVAGIGENSWSSNGMEYDSKEEAEKALDNLSGRWFGYDLSRVVPSTTASHEKVDYKNDSFYQKFRSNMEDGGNLSRDRKFQSQEDWEQRYKRKTYPKHPHYGHKMAGGGGLKPGEGYGKLTDKLIWNNEWNYDQREHFLKDHFQNLDQEIVNDLVRDDFHNLPMEVQIAVEIHRIQGKYKQGGNLSQDNDENIDVYGYTSQYFVLDAAVVEAFKKAIEQTNLDADLESAYYQAQKEHLEDLAIEVDKILALEWKAVVDGQELTEEDYNSLVTYVANVAVLNHKCGDYINMPEALGPHLKLLYNFKKKPAPKPEPMKRGGTIDSDTPIIPEIIADNVAREILMYPVKTPTAEEINTLPERLEKLASLLVDKANTLYKTSPFFKRKINGAGNKGRDALSAFMHHWSPALVKKNFAAGGNVPSQSLEEYLSRINLPKITSLGISQQEDDFVSAVKCIEANPALQKAWEKCVVKSVDGFLSRSFDSKSTIDFVKASITSKPALWASLQKERGLFLNPADIPVKYQDWLAKLLVSGIYGEFELYNSSWNKYLPESMKKEIEQVSVNRGKQKLSSIIHASRLTEHADERLAGYEMGGNLDLIFGNPSYPNDFRFDIHGPMFKEGGMLDFNKYKLVPVPGYKYQNILTKWFEDNGEESITYKLAILLLLREKDPEKILEIDVDDPKEYNRYCRLLRRIDSISESKHEGQWRNNNFSLWEAEQWARESIEEKFTLEPLFESGGQVNEPGVAEIIRDQIGHKALYMLGAYNLAKDTKENSFSFKIRGSKKANYIKIKLEPDDTYTMEFGKIRQPSLHTALKMTPEEYMAAMYKVVNEVKGVHAEDLNGIIEENTGLYTRLFEKGGQTGYGEGGLRHALLETVSSGTIGSMTKTRKYKDIDGIRTTAIQMLLRDGDQPYSLDNLKKLLGDAVEEWKENEAEFSFQEKNHEKGGYAGGGRIGLKTWLENNAENIVKHYLPSAEPNEVFQQIELREKGDYVIEQEHAGKYAGTFIEICFGDKYEKASQDIDKNYKSFTSYFSELKGGDLFEVNIGTDDESKTINFLLTKHTDLAKKSGRYEKGGSLNEEELGMLNKDGFTISKMNELLQNKFPDSFRFQVYHLAKDTRDVDLKTDFDREIKDTAKKFKFPLKKQSRELMYKIFQGQENTYFYFILEDKNDDEQYIGNFGFKDQGDVSDEYITRFIAFLMEAYGYPFSVKQVVMKDGGQIYKQYEYNQLPNLFDKGDKFRVHGWIMLNGVDEGDYEVVESGDYGVKFVKLLKSGKHSTKEIHHRKSSLLSSLNTFLRGDNNGIELLKSSKIAIIEKVTVGNPEQKKC